MESNVNRNYSCIKCLWKKSLCRIAFLKAMRGWRADGGGSEALDEAIAACLEHTSDGGIVELIVRHYVALGPEGHLRRDKAQVADLQDKGNRQVMRETCAVKFDKARKMMGGKDRDWKTGRQMDGWCRSTAVYERLEHTLLV